MRFGAVVLAAGRATRMGGVNKLLAEVDGQAIIERAVAAALASRADPVVVVTGHEQARMEAALGRHIDAGRLMLVHNPDFATGLSTSLHRGVAALPEGAAGVVVCLGDMPGITPAIIDRLIAAFDPSQGSAICLPTWHGKRGNPVLLARSLFVEIEAISGDRGARVLIGRYPEAVCEVAVDDLPGGEAVLHDVDTPEALAALDPGR